MPWENFENDLTDEEIKEKYKFLGILMFSDNLYTIGIIDIKEKAGKILNISYY